MSESLTLYIGNKNYSSWSMRAWVLLRQKGIAFREVKVRFDSFAADSEFKRIIRAINPTGTVPVLVDGNLVIWDSLAIAEYAAEKYPALGLWPSSAAHRARARSICAEMHAGFAALRSSCPMNIEADLHIAGAIAWRDNARLRQDVARLEAMWGELLRVHGGPFLFGDFCVADAYFAPVVMRLLRYALPVGEATRHYMDTVCATSAVQQWVADALNEHDFRPFEEPYRMQGSTS
ncbi:glutathione S-transferase [Lampropedia cohaerens]|uniref:Glutathione S-transferase n=1 Tax=Lampropedia cohaerens TaxID=1610491 RepID=A0A0U1PWP9_9BURK|nr:glutathione S-transferase family protein [Lampropedia cohaerens]KKW66785.1 glutathione S-transferase [Lampropedia cohaerens]